LIKARTKKSGKKKDALVSRKRKERRKVSSPAVIQKIQQRIPAAPLPGAELRREDIDAKRSAPSDAPAVFKNSKKRTQRMTHQPGPAEKPFVDSCDIPSSYGTTRLTLMTRDTNWVHAYWEIAPSAIEAVRNQIGDELSRSAYVLRLYDVTLIQFNGCNANHWFDIEVGPFSNNWYINLWADAVSYCADLGVRAPDGRFFRLARSNTVHTPRKNYVRRPETIWMEVKDRRDKARPFVIGEITRITQERSSRHKLPRHLIGKRRRFYLTEDDIRLYYAGLSPLLMDIIAQRLARDYKRKYGKLVAFTIALEQGGGIAERRRGRYYNRMFLGASEEMIFLGASESQKGGASEKAPKARTFRFSIGTELIVYGRTDPDAEVWLGNKKVPLRKDGTFSMRFALPDGAIPLDFTATSNDKREIRKISTTVVRSTKTE